VIERRKKVEESVKIWQFEIRDIKEETGFV